VISLEGSERARKSLFGKARVYFRKDQRDPRASTSEAFGARWKVLQFADSF
jgi:hypothetical protein